MMPSFKPPPLDYRKILFVLIWLSVWFFPWQELFPIPSNLYLVMLLDMFRLGIALIAFILPGVFLYFLLEAKSGKLTDIWEAMPVGFAFSIALIGAIGLPGKFACLL